MNIWFVLGLLLCGAGLGALLTSIAYSGELRRIRGEISRLAYEPGGTGTSVYLKGSKGWP